jgi:putative ATP-binding cassette transporter
MNFFAFLLRESRIILLAAVAAGLVGGVGNAALLAVINDQVTGTKMGGGRSLLWAFIGLALLITLSRAASTLVLLRLGEKTVAGFRMKLGRSIMSAPLRQLEQLGAPRLLAMLTGDIPTITNAVLVVPDVAINAAIVAACLVYLGWLSPAGLLVLAVFLVAGIAGYSLAIRIAVRHFLAARQENDTLLRHFRALTEGMKELKMHRRRRRQFLSGVLRTTVEKLYRSNVAGGSVYTAAETWGRLLLFLVLAMVLFAQPGGARADSHTLTGFALGLLYLIYPLQMVLNALPTFGRAGAALKHLGEMDLELRAEAIEGESEAKPLVGPGWDRLELLHVSHTYARPGEDGRFRLGPISLRLAPGDLVFLAGGNGSGKTTLAKLLTGLYVPESGEIRLGGVEITDSNRESYRQYFSAVFSDSYPFESLLGLEAAPQEVQRHLELLQLTHKVKIDQGVLSTTDLSQGQRKRLALLTAYLEDRPIYVFDEWAADQDPFFRELFYGQLLPGLKARGKAVLVISHDAAYYGIGDRVIRLDYGRMIEEADDAGMALELAGDGLDRGG